MFKFNVKWTTAESSFFHFALSLLVSVIMSVVVASAQYLTNGQFNLQELGVIAAAAFVGSFSRGIISLEGNPNLMPAILDAVNQLQTLTAQQPPTPQAPFAPYVTIHTGNAPTVEPPPANIRQLNAFPIPQRPIVQPPIQMPQEVPAVDVAKITTAQVQAVPDLSMPQRIFSTPLPVVPGQ